MEHYLRVHTRKCIMYMYDEVVVFMYQNSPKSNQKMVCMFLYIKVNFGESQFTGEMNKMREIVKKFIILLFFLILFRWFILYRNVTIYDI